MANIFLTKGKLMNLLDLEHIDILAFIISGVCHDFGHDGYTNLFHINAVTDRAVRYNDIAV
jgi:3',5'-cyclic-nucleotide phosphodiesterase